jgi:hypothetical protein
MHISHEAIQQILTYIVDFFGFIAIFILPCHYIAKLHIQEVYSWGRPGKIPYERVAPIKSKVEPFKKRNKKIEKFSTKTKQSRKKAA